MKEHASVVVVLVVLVGLLSSQVLADVYLHNPRGSNNRLNEANQNRDNANRMCDTQNNDKGGYCWGPPMYFYVGSHLMVEWTNQHACANPKVDCNIIIQYMCGAEVRDGTVTDTIPDDAGAYNQKVTRENPITGEDEQVFKYGMHENYQYYQDCKARERNAGLFTADQNMNGRNAAINTRQDNNGNRNGFECPEERDYYPYWHPTPWKDIAILVNNEDHCDFFQKESQNVKAKHYCSVPAHNNQAACTQNGGTWVKRTAWDIDPPVCEKAQWTRDNHLGNSVNEFHRGYASSFNWTIPNDPHENCVLRLRYNISTGDYEGWGLDDEDFVDATSNGNPLSPVEQDAIVEYFGNFYELALNTDQYGRTFQDRSHVFEIRERPDDIDDDATIWNVNVRGKRGNIVQVFPAVEYDFVPNRLHVGRGDYIHFQWTGCDTNPANNDGEGRAQTDRSNIAQILSQNHNYPWSDPEDPMFEDERAQQRMAFIDQVNCLPLQESNDDQDVRNCLKLNAARTPYFDGGIYRMNRTGEWHYMCTRNNNFSNRSQKGYIAVDETFPTWAIVLIVLLVVFIAAAALVAGVLLYARAHPHSKLGAKLFPNQSVVRA